MILIGIGLYLISQNFMFTGVFCIIEGAAILYAAIVKAYEV